MQVINRNAFRFYLFEDDVRTKDPCRKRCQQVKILCNSAGGYAKTHLVTQVQIYSGIFYVKRLNICRVNVQVRYEYVRTFLRSYQVGSKPMYLPRYATVESSKTRLAARLLSLGVSTSV